MNQDFIVKCIKDIGVLMEGTMHVPAPSKRKAKKAFRSQYKNWMIVDIKAKPSDIPIQLTPECKLEIDSDIIG